MSNPRDFPSDSYLETHLETCLEPARRGGDCHDESVIPSSANRSRSKSATDRMSYMITRFAVALIFLGVCWRFIDLGYPPSFSFDEHHFVRNARNYITRQPDVNDHPPLGKLILIPAMKLFGDNGMGWRLSSAVLGMLLIGVAGTVAAQTFKSYRVGLLTAAFVSMDGFFVSYARVALLDTPLTFFIYFALALMLWGRSLYWFAGAAISIGLAVATKWTGVCVILVAPILLANKRRGVWHAIWMFALASAVYVAVNVIALRITRQPISSTSILGTNLALLKHHAGFTYWDNAASSKWYTWPLLVHPIVMHYADYGPSMVRATSSIGNPVLWFATTAALLFALGRAGSSSWRAFRFTRNFSALKAPELFAMVTMFALMTPFIFSHRQSYIFHYLGAYGLGLGVLASSFVKVERRSPGIALIFLVVAAAVSVYYAPVWTEGLISHGGFVARLPFPGWR